MNTTAVKKNRREAMLEELAQETEQVRQEVTKIRLHEPKFLRNLLNAIFGDGESKSKG